MVESPIITPVVRKIMEEYCLSEAIVTEIYHKLRMGARIKDISEIYGLPYAKAMSIAHELGFRYKNNTEVEQQIIQLRKQGLSYKEIMEKLGVSKYRVWNTLRKHGLIGKDHKADKEQELEKKIIELRKQGYTYSKIAEELGISKSKIHRVLKKYNELGEEALRKPKEIVIDVPEDEDEDEEYTRESNKEETWKTIEDNERQESQLVIEIGTNKYRIRIIIDKDIRIKVIK